MSEMNQINEREGPASDSSASSGQNIDFSAMLNKVLANPQILSTVASALSGTAGDGTETGTVTQRSEPEEKKDKNPSDEPSPSPDVAAMAQKLPEIINMLGPVMTPKGAYKQQSYQNDKRACLLNAMKPYMNPQRCEAIDYIIKFSQISEILKNIT